MIHCGQNAELKFFIDIKQVRIFAAVPVDLTSIAGIDDEVAKMMGFGGFDTTKNKKVRDDLTIFHRLFHLTISSYLVNGEVKLTFFCHGNECTIILYPIFESEALALVILINSLY